MCAADDLGSDSYDDDDSDCCGDGEAVLVMLVIRIMTTIRQTMCPVMVMWMVAPVSHDYVD